MVKLRQENVCLGCVIVTSLLPVCVKHNFRPFITLSCYNIMLTLNGTPYQLNIHLSLYSSYSTKEDAISHNNMCRPTCCEHCVQQWEQCRCSLFTVCCHVHMWPGDIYFLCNTDCSSWNLWRLQCRRVSFHRYTVNKVPTDIIIALSSFPPNKGQPITIKQCSSCEVFRRVGLHQRSCFS